MSSSDCVIQIYVRSPNSSIPKDYHINTTPEANITSIKQQIHDTLEAHPSLEDQRLIFQGKILANEEVIKDIFKKVDLSAPQVFHLVVKSGLTSELQPQTCSTFANQASSTYGLNAANSLRQRFQSQFDEPFENSFYQAPTASPPATAGSAFGTLPENAAIPPHLVTNLGLSYQYQYVLINGLPYLMQTPNQLPPNIGYPMNYGPGIANPLEAPEPLMAPMPPNLIPPEMNGAQRHRQAVHSLWLVFRLVFFAYLFGQGASFERMILISLVCMVIYLYQTGRLRVVRVQINQLNQLNPRNPPDIFPPNHQNPGQPPLPNPNPTQQPQTQTQPQPQPQPQQPQSQSQQQENQPSQQDTHLQEPPQDTLGILKVAVFTFFRSIIPSDQIRDIPAEDIENEMF